MEEWNFSSYWMVENNSQYLLSTYYWSKNVGCIHSLILTTIYCCHILWFFNPHPRKCVYWLLERKEKSWGGGKKRGKCERETWLLFKREMKGREGEISIATLCMFPYLESNSPPGHVHRTIFQPTELYQLGLIYYHFILFIF